MTAPRPAIALFVKTPELSPVKTRLAERLGPERTLRFFELACAATTEVLVNLSAEVEPYFAVAEPQGLDSPRWRSLPCIAQGEGALGARLHTVYSSLQQKHHYVLCLGMDSPQITSSLIRRALKAIQTEPTPTFTLGPALDGGFYLAGGNAPVEHEDFTSVKYSTAHTLRGLRANLEKRGRITLLPTLTDVDTTSDLKQLLTELCAEESLTAAQMALLDFLRTTNEALLDDEGRS